jgi:hypothetical protein
VKGIANFGFEETKRERPVVLEENLRMKETKSLAFISHTRKHCEALLD